MTRGFCSPPIDDDRVAQLSERRIKGATPPWSLCFDRASISGRFFSVDNSSSLPTRRRGCRPRARTTPREALQPSMKWRANTGVD